MLNAAYLAKEGKSLEKTILDATAGSYESVLLALAKDPVDYDAWLLNAATAGLGTNETLLVSLLFLH